MFEALQTGIDCWVILYIGKYKYMEAKLSQTKYLGYPPPPKKKKEKKDIISCHLNRSIWENVTSNPYIIYNISK